MPALKAQIFVLQCQDTYGWIMLLSSNPLYTNVMLHSVFLWGFSNLCLNVKWSSRRQRLPSKLLTSPHAFFLFTFSHVSIFYRFPSTAHSSFLRTQEHVFTRKVLLCVHRHVDFYWFMSELCFASVAGIASSSDIIFSFLSLTSPSRPQCQTRGLQEKHSSNSVSFYFVCTILFKTWAIACAPRC